LEFNDIIKTGRTHMQDAVPLSLGQEFSAYVSQVTQARARIARALEDCYELPLGGTAIGTGITAYAGYDVEVAHEIARLTGLPFKTAENKFVGTASHDSLVDFSGAIKSLACALFKMGYDLRILSSGPRTGIGELHLPENEPGSSIMPGKINPSQCEALRMVCAYVMGNDVALSWCCALGDLQLNIYGPLMAYTVLQSVDTLADGCSSFAKYCIHGVQPNRARIEYLLQNSLILVTALSPKIGYDKAAHVAHTAIKENITLRQAAINLGYLTGEEYDTIVNVKNMIQPNRN
jgi:fumarate hydratase class II